MLPVDDLDAGMMITIMGAKGGLFVQQGGVPLKVVAMQLPFIVVEEQIQHVRGVLDTRLFNLMQVDDTYVQAYTEERKVG